VSSTKVHNGDIDGWSWTPQEAHLPAASMQDVLNAVGLAATPGAGTPEPTAIVKTIYPVGVSPSTNDDGQSVGVYLGAGAIFVGICLSAAFVIRRSRFPRTPQP
jgi:hypothetical protein